MTWVPGLSDEKLAQEVLDSRRLIAVLIQKLGGEVLISDKDLMDAEGAFSYYDMPTGGRKFFVEK